MNKYFMKLVDFILMKLVQYYLSWVVLGIFLRLILIGMSIFDGIVSFIKNKGKYSIFYCIYDKWDDLGVKMFSGYDRKTWEKAKSKWEDSK